MQTTKFIYTTSANNIKSISVSLFFHILVMTFNGESLLKLYIIYMYQPLLLVFQVLLTGKLSNTGPLLIKS